MKARLVRPAILILLGVALAGGLLYRSRPAAIAELLQRTDGRGVAVAFALMVAVLVLRATRLVVLLGGRIGLAAATGVTGVAQLASAVAPLRLGELAFVPLLRRAGVPGTLRALSFLALGRLLDLGAILLWAVVAALGAGRSPADALLVLACATAVGAAGLAAVQRLLLRVAHPWRRAGGLRRRILAQALRIRAEIGLLRRQPMRGVLAAALSFAAWGGVWALTTVLVHAMGLTWTANAVLTGVVGASLGASLPVNAAGNFGTLEAGWTAALAAAGVPAAEALPAGFATHLWGLVFNVALGTASVLLLVRRHGPRDARARRR